MQISKILSWIFTVLLWDLTLPSEWNENRRLFKLLPACTNVHDLLTSSIIVSHSTQGRLIYVEGSFFVFVLNSPDQFFFLKPHILLQHNWTKTLGCVLEQKHQTSGNEIRNVICSHRDEVFLLKDFSLVKSIYFRKLWIYLGFIGRKTLDFHEFPWPSKTGIKALHIISTLCPFNK